MKLRRDLSITQKSAWRMMKRVRDSYNEVNELFVGEVDKSHFGGKESNERAGPAWHSYREHDAGHVRLHANHATRGPLSSCRFDSSIGDRNAMLGQEAIHSPSLIISTISSMENPTNHIHIQRREMVS